MDIKAIMAQAKKMQADVDKAKNELYNQEFVVEKQGLKITCLGNRVVKSLIIDPILVDPEDKDILESLIIIAINEVNSQISEAEEKLKPAGMPF